MSQYSRGLFSSSRSGIWHCLEGFRGITFILITTEQLNQLKEVINNVFDIRNPPKTLGLKDNDISMKILTNISSYTKQNFL